VLENFDALGIAAVLDIAGSLHSDDVLFRIGRVGGEVKLGPTRTCGSAKAGGSFPPRLQWVRRRTCPFPTRP
jgi:hypothetical protein